MNKETIMGLIRHTLTFVGGFVVMMGLADEGLVTEITGGLMAAVGFVWSIYDKLKK